MANRSIDYYIKSLDIEVRQEIYRMLDDVNPSTVKKLLEKDEDYPTWRSMGFKSDAITAMLSKNAIKFSAINKAMMENQRPPLFEKPSDTYGSAQKYVDLLKEKTPEELEKEFGCSWEDYVPAKYERKAAEAPILE